MSKTHLIKVAEDTLNIIKNGKYTNDKRKELFVKNDIDFAVNNSILYSPEDGDKLIEKIQPSNSKEKTIFETTGESTLKASQRLIEEGNERVIALNFASARNPGGGFLKGSNAQEESIARASALYSCISKMNKMYEYNRKNKSTLYSDYMIYSPKVPVFKDTMGNVLDEPYHCSFITSPAVNVKALDQSEKLKVREVMKKRIEKILSVAIENNYDVIVLGAFGCGVFGNRPADVTQIFGQVLNSQKFKGKFKKVVFAIYDKTPDKQVFKVFKNIFK